MDKISFLKIIDFIRDYGIQTFGIIIIILLSRYFMQTLLWLLSLVVSLLLFIVHLLFSLFHIMLSILPGALQEKLNSVIVKIETVIRKNEAFSYKLKGWFRDAPSSYVHIHRRIVQFIKAAVLFAALASLFVLIFNVFIQKSLTVKQIIEYIPLDLT